VTKKSNDLTNQLNEAISVATSVAYTKKEIDKLKTELYSLLEKKSAETIVEYVQVPGPPGQRGLFGSKGDKGDKGDTGDVGPIGPKGDKGEVGPQGNLGLEGPRGLKGDKGDKGDTGAVGPQGEQGIQGIAGERGDKGEKGDRGTDGKNGLDGRDGQTGAVGPAGSIGPQGVQGERGLKGDKGERGQDGQQGTQGPTGPKGEIGPQGVQGLPGKDGKDGDIKPVEEKFQKFIDNVQKDVSAFKTKVNAVILKSGPNDSYKATGSGEVNLRYLDDVDRDSITDGYVLSYDEASQKFVFVEGGAGGGTIDTVARTRSTSAWYTANLAYTQANSAFSTSNNSYTQANTALSIAQSAFAQANTGSAAGTDNLARSIANSSFSTANSALSIAQSAFAQANTGGGGGAATDSLNIIFGNHNATAYKVVAINADSETILASTLDLTQANKVVGILDANNETVTLGTLTNPSWTWTADQTLYLSSNGDIVTTPTIDGATFSLKVGYSLSATKVFVKIGTPVVL